MNTRTASRLATALAAALGALAGALFILVLVIAPGIGRVPGSFDTGSWTDEVPLLMVNVVAVLVGAVIAAKRPRNPIGWLLALLGLGFIAYPVVVIVVASVRPEGADAPLWVHLVAWVGNWIWILGHAGALFLLLLFPTGRPLSRRWRPVVWLAGALVGVLFVVAATHEGPLEAAPQLENPLGLPMPDFIVYALIGGLLALEFLACALLVVRFFRSRGDERQQMKWVAFGVVILAAYLLLNLLFGLPRWSSAVASAALIAAIAVSVLRYRLYDIDVLINRTLVYGSLTATLALIYFGGVATTQAIFRNLTGQEQQPQLAIVVSTLVIAALFNPLRRRVQSFIDRRFYRRKYDARKTLEAFSARLRDETDLHALNNHVVEVVRETMQPAHVSLWLRPEAVRKGKQAD